MAHLIDSLGYLGLFVVMALGNMGAPAGTEIVMPTAGALAAQGHLAGLGAVPAWIVVGAVGTLGELAGASILYAVGYYGGEPFLERYGRYVGFKQKELARVHAFYDRFGNATVFWCRFIPFVRGVASFPAGVARMSKRWFVTFTALGSVIFCFGLAYLGDSAGHNIDALAAGVHKAGLGILAAVLVVIVAAAVALRLRAKRKRPESEPT